MGNEKGFKKMKYLFNISLLLTTTFLASCSSAPKKWMMVNERAIASEGISLSMSQDYQDVADVLKIDFLPMKDQKLPVKVYFKNTTDKMIKYSRKHFHFLTRDESQVIISKENDFDGELNNWIKIKREYDPSYPLKVMAVKGEANLPPQTFTEDIIYLDLSELKSLDELNMFVSSDLIRSKQNLQLRFVAK